MAVSRIYAHKDVFQAIDEFLNDPPPIGTIHW